MRNLVFTPTWNEAENIALLIKDVFAAVPDAHMLIVDDQSPDGTGQIAESMSGDFPNLHVLHRQGPRGRGWAGIAAYIWALDHEFDRVIEMDADFSHQPCYIPSLLAALDEFDMVLGSRYVPGGEDRRPGFHRHVISRLAGRYQQIMFGAPVRDCTSGFRGYRSPVLETIGVRNLTTWGPAILSDVLYRVIRHGFKIAEVPIIFPDRERGQSTLTPKILFEGLWNVAKLKFSGK
ncbi:polyprenol monophosphomannose synthase [bacterium]|nr:polyprenol monophosphomannose synthase [candidate division CSSED10-310 bacterium]